MSVRSDKIAWVRDRARCDHSVLFRLFFVFLLLFDKRVDVSGGMFTHKKDGIEIPLQGYL